MAYNAFDVRGSGRFPGKFYIDLNGKYAAGDIAEAVGSNKETVEKLYERFSAVYEEALGVYFFSSREEALQAKKALDEKVSDRSGKTVFLTYEEIDYIRQALINEGSNVISVRNELKKNIFDKFHL